MASSTPIYVQLRNQIVKGIGKGELKAGEKLPTVRQLASDAGVNTMTVNKTYQILKNEGFIFRTYNINKIKDIRFIEPWQWQYIPFLKYKQSVKESILTMIQNITGINKINI